MQVETIFTVGNTNIRVERLRSGNYIARPAAALGTCGNYPFPWTACIAATMSKAYLGFIDNHMKHLGA